MRRSVVCLAAFLLACSEAAETPDASNLDAGVHPDAAAAADVPNTGDSGLREDATVSEDATVAGDAGFADAHQPSTELARLLSELDKARNGMAADLDGDGRAELTRTVDPDGTIHTSIDVDGDGTADFVLDLAPDGSGALTSDGDANGTPEVEASFSSGNPRTRTFLRDSNVNGAFDRRTTETYGADSVLVALEIDPEEDGTFTASTSETQPLPVFADGCTDEQKFGEFPPTDGPAVRVTENIRVLYGSAPGACTLDEARDIASAIDRAAQRAMACVSANNTELAGTVAEAMASDRELYFACGNRCPGGAAATDCTNGCNVTSVNLNRSFFSGNLNELTNTALHEMFHWAGAGREADHDNGKDAVYACARYCSNCSHNTAGWESDHKDCVACADTMARKQACGMRTSYVAPSVNYSICHAGLACSMAPCMTPRGIRIEVCDGPVMQTGEDWVCCAECPANCNRSNDQPCNNLPPEMDECMMPPPACR